MNYDIIVVGAGHAGVEAALASASNIVTIHLFESAAPYREQVTNIQAVSKPFR